MTGSNARFRMRFGNLEIEYEGDATVLKSELIEIAKEILELGKTHPPASASFHGESVPETDGGGITGIDLSTDTIANLLNEDSGPGLIIAAAAHLQLTAGKSTFTRKQLIDEMRNAPSHFKESYVGNLTANLKSLTSKDRLRLVTKDVYSLSKTEKTKIEKDIADN